MPFVAATTSCSFSLVAAVGSASISSVAMLPGEFEPSFGDFKQFGLFFFASSQLRGSQSLLSVAALLFSLADHVIAAETFRKNRFREEDVEGPVGCQLDLGPTLFSGMALLLSLPAPAEQPQRTEAGGEWRCPLWVKSRHSQRKKVMSALPKRTFSIALQCLPKNPDNRS